MICGSKIATFPRVERTLLSALTASCCPHADKSVRSTRSKSIARALSSTNGTEIAEAALVLPLVFMFLLGIIWFGRAFNIYSTIQQAAQQGAIAAARATCATCATSNSFPTAATVDNAIYTVMQASKLDVTQIQLPTNPPTCGAGQTCISCPSLPPPSTGACTANSNIYVCQNVQINLVAAGQVTAQTAQCGTVVSFQYPFKFNFPGTSLNMQQIILSAQAQSRMEN